MKYNQELYQEFVQRKAARQSFQVYAHTFKRRAILQRFIELPDQNIISLQSSIPLLRNLGVISVIESVDHIVQLMKQKEVHCRGWEGVQRQLWECRLIYFLWDVISEEQIEMRSFKELLLILLNNESNREQEMEDCFGNKEEIQQLIETWDYLFMQAEKDQQFGQQGEINDISIIKSKNEGTVGEQKQNINNENRGFQTDRMPNNDCKQPLRQHSRSRSKFQKSYHKETAKTAVEKSNSLGRINSKRSQYNSLANYVSAGLNPVNFFRENDCLSVCEEKKLVERLYNCDIYKQREEQKKKIDEERIKIELNSCTFKPQIRRQQNTRSRAKINPNPIKGYQQAIDRMKSGYQKQKELKQNLEFRAWKEGPTLNGKPTIGYTPKFHSRPVKQHRTELFELKFTLGKLIIPVKIRQEDKVSQLVYNIGRIYSLKEYQKVYIQDSILQALEEYSQIYGRPSQQMPQ